MALVDSADHNEIEQAWDVITAGVLVAARGLEISASRRIRSASAGTASRWSDIWV